MRIISSTEIATSVEKIIGCAELELNQSVLERIVKARKNETSSIACELLDEIIENARIASATGLPLCQDTGSMVFFIRMGQDVSIEGDSLNEAVSEGVRLATENFYLRSSIVGDPLRRKNTGDNTPPVIHIEPTPGDEFSITFTARGGGSDNMSVLKMLSPGAGRRGVIECVVNAVKCSGGKSCPPLLIGVGIGGVSERVGILATNAYLRENMGPHTEPYYAELENEIIKEVNATGIGPMGLGGDTTALGVFIEYAACHIASLPAAVYLGCHSVRHSSISL